MTCLDRAGDKEKRLEKQREVYEKVLLPMVREMNRSPGEWLRWHGKKKKKELEAKLTISMNKMEKICGHRDSDVFKKLKYDASVAEGCDPLRKSFRTEKNGGVRPTKAQHQATGRAIHKVRWGTSQLSMHMHTHAQLLGLQMKKAEQCSLKKILEQHGLLQLFLDGVKLDARGKAVFPEKLYDQHDVYNLTQGVGQCEILVRSRSPQNASK